jgi:hypothetical protein
MVPAGDVYHQVPDPLPFQKVEREISWFSKVDVIFIVVSLSIGDVKIQLKVNL